MNGHRHTNHQTVSHLALKNMCTMISWKSLGRNHQKFNLPDICKQQND